MDKFTNFDRGDDVTEFWGVWWTMHIIMVLVIFPLMYRNPQKLLIIFMCVQWGFFVYAVYKLLKYNSSHTISLVIAPFLTRKLFGFAGWMLWLPIVVEAIVILIFRLKRTEANEKWLKDKQVYCEFKDTYQKANIAAKEIDDNEYEIGQLNPLACEYFVREHRDYYINEYKKNYCIRQQFMQSDD